MRDTKRENPVIGIYHANTGACNGCDIEIIASTIPPFNISRFGCRFVERPEDAKILTVTGPVTMKIADDLRRVYEQIQEPKLVVVVGTCATSKAAYDGSYSCVGPIDQLFPVDIYVEGCPPRPQAIVQGVLMALHKLGTENIPYNPLPAPEGFRGKPEFDVEKCNGCEACATACPSQAITVAEKNGKKVLELFYGKCLFCAQCEEVCPKNAIHLTSNFELAVYTREEAKVRIELDEERCEKCGQLIGPVPLIKELKEKMAEFELPKESIEKFETTLKLCRRCKAARMRGRRE